MKSSLFFPLEVKMRTPGFFNEDDEDRSVDRSVEHIGMVYYIVFWKRQLSCFDAFYFLIFLSLFFSSCLADQQLQKGDIVRILADYSTVVSAKSAGSTVDSIGLRCERADESE